MHTQEPMGWRECIYLALTALTEQSCKTAPTNGLWEKARHMMIELSRASLSIEVDGIDPLMDVVQKRHNEYVRQIAPHTGNEKIMLRKEGTQMSDNGNEQIWMSSADVGGIPPHLESRGTTTPGGGKWEPLRQLIVNEMGPKAKQYGKAVKQLTFANQEITKKAQAAAGSASYRKKRGHAYTKFREPAFKIRTRSEPVNSVDKSYHLYIEVTYDHMTHN